MSENSSRRIISRHKISNEDDSKNRSDYKVNNMQQNQPTQKTKESESVPTSQLLVAQTVNYLNKEPFNEDATIEESYLGEDHANWKALVLDKLRTVIDTLKNLKNNPLENVNLMKIKKKQSISKNKNFLEKCSQRSVQKWNYSFRFSKKT